MDDKLILYHGSQEIVEFPEIRLQRYNKDFYFGNIEICKGTGGN